MNNLKLFALAAMAAGSTCAAAQTNNSCGLVGFANYRDLGTNGTTGGGQGEVTRVTTRQQLEEYAKGNTPRVIIVENDITGNGNIGTGEAGKKDVISVGSNKTIIGAGKGVTLEKVGFDLNGQQNVIFRNLRIKDCNPDALAFRDTHHVWVDHCELASSSDGLLDFTIGSSYLSVSWTKFSDHDKASICNSGTNHFEDHGKERATYHHCWFDNTVQRNPRFGYGLGHVFNNYYTNNDSYCVGYHTRAKVVVENSYFKNTSNPLNQMYTSDPLTANYADCLARGNKYDNVSGNTKDTGTGFDIANYYGYGDAMQDAADVEEACTTAAGLADGLENAFIPFPGNYATDVLKNYKLQVGAIYGATAYKYYIGEAGDDHAALVPYDPATTTLAPSTEYVWTAQANAGETTLHSESFWFTTAPEKASKPTPENMDLHAKLREALKDKTPTTPAKLRWRDAFDATAYRVYISQGKTVDDNAFLGETTTTEIDPGVLAYGTQYTWRVDAVKENGDVVKGDDWTFTSDLKAAHYGRTEMEEATLSGIAYIETTAGTPAYSADKAVVGEAGPGSMSVVWSEDDGECDITTTFFDWQKKNGTYTLYVNEEKQDTWVASVDGKNMFTHTSKNVKLRRGDEIRINFCTDGNQRMRTDCIDIAQSASTGIDDISAPANTRRLRIYTIDGRYAGDKVEGLGKGLYIINGKKVAL